MLAYAIGVCFHPRLAACIEKEHTLTYATAYASCIEKEKEHILREGTPESLDSAPTFSQRLFPGFGVQKRYFFG